MADNSFRPIRLYKISKGTLVSIVASALPFSDPKTIHHPNDRPNHLALPHRREALVAAA
jgi:hypothetical protein